MEAPEKLVSQLKVAKLTVACAESCTGGLIADAIVSVPGASEVFPGGAVSYSNAIKESLLGVKEETLRKHTEISGECACEMADGARRVFGADIGISTTGIAGPGGGSDEHPVGLVYIGFSGFGRCFSEKHIFKGSRSEIRNAAAARALEMAAEQLSGESLREKQ